MPSSDVEADAPIAAAGEAEDGALSLASQDLQLVPVAAIASHRGTLRRLDLQRNRLDDLPAQLFCSDSSVGGRLQALTHLNISRNNLKQLPVEIGQLQCLVELIALSNNIKPSGLPVEQVTTPTLHTVSAATQLSAPTIRTPLPPHCGLYAAAALAQLSTQRLGLRCHACKVLLTVTSRYLLHFRLSSLTCSARCTPRAPSAGPSMEQEAQWASGAGAASGKHPAVRGPPIDEQAQERRLGQGGCCGLPGPRTQERVRRGSGRNTDQVGLVRGRP